MCPQDPRCFLYTLKYVFSHTYFGLPSVPDMENINDTKKCACMMAKAAALKKYDAQCKTEGVSVVAITEKVMAAAIDG